MYHVIYAAKFGGVFRADWKKNCAIVLRMNVSTNECEFIISRERVPSLVKSLVPLFYWLIYSCENLIESISRDTCTEYVGG